MPPPTLNSEEPLISYPDAHNLSRCSLPIQILTPIHLRPRRDAHPTAHPAHKARTGHRAKLSPGIESDQVREPRQAWATHEPPVPRQARPGCASG